LDIFGQVEVVQEDIQAMAVMVEKVGYMRLDQVTEEVEVEAHYLQVKVAPVEEWAFMVRAVTVAAVLIILLLQVYKVAAARVEVVVYLIISHLLLTE
jgi:hypothetical protein